MNKAIVIGGVLFYLYCRHQRKNPPKIYYRKKLFNNYNGYNIPPIGIFIKESERNNIPLLQHELIHWKQFQREGLISFLVNYSNEARARGYDQNRYEIEARQFDNDFSKRNYTFAVRNGYSDTVYNPNFRR